jgi:hypothetical protein
LDILILYRLRFGRRTEQATSTARRISPASPLVELWDG